MYLAPVSFASLLTKRDQLFIQHLKLAYNLASNEIIDCPLEIRGIRARGTEMGEIKGRGPAGENRDPLKDNDAIKDLCARTAPGGWLNR